MIKVFSGLGIYDQLTEFINKTKEYKKKVIMKTEKNMYAIAVGGEQIIVYETFSPERPCNDIQCYGDENYRYSELIDNGFKDFDVLLNKTNPRKTTNLIWNAIIQSLEKIYDKYVMIKIINGKINWIQVVDELSNIDVLGNSNISIISINDIEKKYIDILKEKYPTVYPKIMNCVKIYNSRICVLLFPYVK